MGLKYEFTDKTINHDVYILHRLKRLDDRKLGGYIEKEDNLSQKSDCCVSEYTKVYDAA